MQLELFEDSTQLFGWRGILFGNDDKPIGILGGQLRSDHPLTVCHVIQKVNPMVRVQEVWNE